MQLPNHIKARNRFSNFFKGFKIKWSVYRVTTGQCAEAVTLSCSRKKNVFKHFVKFTGKSLCWSVFLKNSIFTEHSLKTAFKCLQEISLASLDNIRSVRDS